MVTQRKPLTVYKASAGSGKTFTLALEYMKLVIEDPTCYRNILAVTFTNKATEEMKMRILSQLYGIWKRLPDSQGYMSRITEDLELSEATASQRAGVALRLLLHNYNYFRVETIDAFFQSVLRNMARELDLTANLRIELNDKQVEQQAVDTLIDGLNAKSSVLGWIMQYIKERMADDKGWDVIALIKDFGMNVFNDAYKRHRKSLNGVLGRDDFFKSYTQKLRSIKEEVASEMEKATNKFFSTLDAHGVTVDDFKSKGKGVAGYFIKLRDGKLLDPKFLTSTAIKGMDDPSAWLTKDHQQPTDALYALVADVLMPMLNATEKNRVAKLRLYKSADVTLKHLNQLRLLGSIEQSVRDGNAETNRFLLSDTQPLLQALIQDSDSPFIFEKIGTRLKHVMIDEFQDTSTIQWKNFKVLLQECMSHEGAKNMVVGDVKQSIYRWRSGDWKLLNNIDSEFTDADKRLDIRSLTTNYRSERNIIDFNNAFFDLATRQEYSELADDGIAEAEQLLQAYSDVTQQPRETTPLGEVHIELIPKDAYSGVVMERVAAIVADILAKGVKMSEIAILVRSNDIIQQLAEYFMENHPSIRLVSDEAFRLDASTAVNTIVSAMRFLAHPDNKIDEAYLSKTLHSAELSTRRIELLAMPLYELAEYLFHIFRLGDDNGQSAYLFAFFDKLKEYLSDHTPDVDGFLKEWDSSLHVKTIHGNEVDGIRLLTIHKSKGLEFGHVIMPSCDWKLEKENASTLWCVPRERPFDELPLAPIAFSRKGMLDTIYEEDYKHEHFQNIVDNLNLLYVAFTRASKGLYILGRRGENGRRSKVIESVFDDLSQRLSTPYTGDIANKNDILRFDYGCFAPARTSASAETANVFLSPVAPHPIVAMENFANRVTFLQSNKSREFVEDDNEQEQQRYIKMGSLLHRVFSTINTAADIDRALTEMETEGILYGDGMSKDQLCTLLRNRLEHPKAKEWFSSRWRLFNECTILHVDPVTGEVKKHRPDRVMTDGEQFIVVDFKFGHPREEYHHQVSQYMDLIAAMGHHLVSGYLWYVYSNKIEKVK